MKKVGELMAELGFKKDSPRATQEAFIKHLIRSAENTYLTTPSEKVEIEKNKLPQITETLTPARTEEKIPAGEIQLSFDFNEVG